MRVKNSPVLGDLVYEKLKDLILTQKIMCGEKILEPLLEKQLGVSRTPVREAVRRLSNEGIVVLYPNRHSEVVSFNAESIKELGMVRISLECLAAQLAIQNGSNKDFDELRELAELCEQAHDKKDLYAQIRYDSDFHMKLVEISQNSLILTIQKTIVLRTRLLQTTLITNATSTICDIRHHASMLEALYDRSLPAVLDAIKLHLCPFYNLLPNDINPITFKS